MKRVTVRAPNDVVVADCPIPKPGFSEVLLKLESAGICGGDLQLMQGHNAVAKYPTGLGHECVARVQAAGPGATLAVGSFVAVYPTISCRACSACKRGAGNQCLSMRVMGLSDPNGCFAEYLVLSERQCVTIPESVALSHGALIEPVAVACHVLRRAGDVRRMTALVIGVGPIGLAVGAIAKERGATVVGCVDRYREREHVSQLLGLGPFSTHAGEPLQGWVRDNLGAVDVIFDTVMSSETSLAAVSLLRPGGRYVAVASARHGQILPLRYDSFFLKELSLTAARNYIREDFEQAASLLEHKEVDLRPLITGTYPLNEFQTALKDLNRDPAKHLKVLLLPPAQDQ